MSLDDIQLIQDLKTCETLWKALSPCETLYDEWDFRYCFFKQHPHHKPYFLTLFHEGKPVGLLPLQLNADRNILEFFGGDFMENNRLFLKTGFESRAGDFFSFPNHKAILTSLRPDGLDFIRRMPCDIPGYTYDLSGLSTLDEFVRRFFKSKSRIRFNGKIQAARKLAPTVVINRLSDIDLMVQFNLDAFGAESSFAKDPEEQTVFHELPLLPYRSLVHSFEINGQIQAVSVSILYKDIYYGLMTGSHKNIPGLTTFVTLKKIETALENHCRLFDAGRHHCNWKELWHMSKAEVYRLEN